MNPILLIAGNFLRQMRWLVLVYPLIAIALGVGFSLFTRPGDQEVISAYLFQLITYALAIAIFLGAQANFNERKSRRILGVLSKGIERRDYLAGLMVGVFASSGVFVVGMLIGALYNSFCYGADLDVVLSQHGDCYVPVDIPPSNVRCGGDVCLDWSRFCARDRKDSGRVSASGLPT